MKNKLFGMLTLFFLVQGFCQGQGVVINEMPPIDKMMDQFKTLNELKPELQGWRIQLLATTDRQKVENEMRRFQSLFPGIPVDWTHSKPYYKLRAGAYLTRLETYRMLYVLKNDYPGAYPAADKLNPKELLK